MKNIVIDTNNLVFNIGLDYDLPVFALASKVFKSNMVYGHRIEFKVAHRYRFQLKELQSLITSYAYTRSSSNDEALAMLYDIRDLFNGQIQAAIAEPYGVDTLMKFVKENYLLVNPNRVLMFGIPLSDTGNVAISDALVSAYPYVKVGELKFIVDHIQKAIHDIQFSMGVD